MKRALLIGINYTNTTSIQLNGCINDIINMRNMLIDAYDYNAANIMMLRDDTTNINYQPTRVNIITNLKNLVAQSTAQDELWIHYSGHGSQLQDRNGDETGKLDSILVPVDYASSGYILDDEILSIIKNIKCRAILLFDACHSGTMCDLPWTLEYKNAYNYSLSSNNQIVIANPNIFMMSGCKDNQTSGDTYDSFSQESGGVFTIAFLTCLRNSRHNISMLLLYRDICNYIVSAGYSQYPLFSSSSSAPKYNLLRALPRPTNMTKAIVITNTIKNSMRTVMNI